MLSVYVNIWVILLMALTTDSGWAAGLGGGGAEGAAVWGGKAWRGRRGLLLMAPIARSSCGAAAGRRGCARAGRARRGVCAALRACAGQQTSGPPLYAPPTVLQLRGLPLARRHCALATSICYNNAPTPAQHQPASPPRSYMAYYRPDNTYISVLTGQTSSVAVQQVVQLGMFSIITFAGARARCCPLAQGGGAAARRAVCTRAQPSMWWSRALWPPTSDPPSTPNSPAPPRTRPAAVEMLLEYGFFKMAATIVAQIIQGGRGWRRRGGGGRQAAHPRRRQRAGGVVQDDRAATRPLPPAPAPAHPPPGSLGFFIFRSRTTAYYFANDVQVGRWCWWGGPPVDWRRLLLPPLV